MSFLKNKIELDTLGYSVTSKLYDDEEICNILKVIDDIKIRDGEEQYAIRQLLKQHPELTTLICNENLMKLIEEIAGKDYFLTKAIYFNKPKELNWFVGFHQDLSVAVVKKEQVDKYENWTYKHGNYGVQPPAEILEATITIRIHLDNTNKDNGALMVIPKSHTNGVIREFTTENRETINVERGSIMLMKPLTLHASNRTINKDQRRVIHLEFCNKNLTKPLNWSEKEFIHLIPCLT